METDKTESREGTISSREYLFELLRDIVITAAVCTILFGVLFNFVIVSGESMNPTLESGSLILIRKAFYTPERGDIVVFNSDGVGFNLVKRVIGVGGDIVNIDYLNGTVMVNGEIQDEPYILEDTRVDLGMEMPVEIPDGYVFVLGDNRNNSEDSRDPRVGLVPENEILGGYFLMLFHPRS